MSEEILINVTPQETRIALVENGVLQEVHIERARRRGLVGNIYKGHVSRVLPGMQAAFVDIGLERAAFLHASDIINQPVEGAPVIEENRVAPITVPSRYLVLMPTARNLGISQKIEEETERQRLKDTVAALAGEMQEGGYIIRTAAEGADEGALRADMEYLRKLWHSTAEEGQRAAPGSIVYEDMPLVLRALRDLVDLDIEKVRIDSRENFKKALAFAQQFVPQVAPRIEYYPGERPIFDLYGVEDEIDKALDRQVLVALQKHLERDRAKSHISEVSSLGLVQMTRKRTRESLEHVLCAPCPTCKGRGSLKTPETVCYEIFRDILREARQFDVQQFLVLASQEVVDVLLDEESTSLAELEAFIGKPIKLQVEALHAQEQFDVVLM